MLELEVQLNWPTRDIDLQVAESIIEEYIEEYNAEGIGIFEMVVSNSREVPDVRLSSWIVELTDYFQREYGAERGAAITDKVVSLCLVNGSTLH